MRKYFDAGLRPRPLSPLEKATTEVCRRAAAREARARGLDTYGSEHLLLGLLEDRTEVIVRTLRRLGVSEAEVRAWTSPPPNEYLGPESLPAPVPTEEVEDIEYRASRLAAEREHLHVEPGHLLLAIARDEDCWASVLLRAGGVDLSQLREVLEGLLHRSADDKDALLPLPYPRLADDAVRRLLEEWHAHRATARLILEGVENLAPAERAKAVGRLHAHEEGSAIVLQLFGHLAHVAWGVAEEFAALGHDFVYVYHLAHRTFYVLLDSYSPADIDRFDTYATSHMKEALDEWLDRAA